MKTLEEVYNFANEREDIEQDILNTLNKEEHPEKYWYRLGKLCAYGDISEFIDED